MDTKQSGSAKKTNNMEVVNCFGDVETVDTGSDEQELVVVGDLRQAVQLDYQVESIHLVGSFIAGCHQELRIHLKSEKCDSQKATSFVRLSRINGTDTIQFVHKSQQCTSSKDSATIEDLPVLLVLNEFPQKLTFQDVKSAFDQSCNLMKRYDQGDCHSLSQMICDLLVPGSFPAETDW